jgi:hypothetical protein
MQIVELDWQLSEEGSPKGSDLDAVRESGQRGFHRKIIALENHPTPKRKWAKEGNGEGKGK